MAGESLIIGNGNWGVKSGNLLGYNLNGGNYVPRELTFTRATTGTRTNGALLVENTPPNLFQYSEQFDNALWGKASGVTVTSNTIASPNGSLTADSFILTSAGSCFVFQPSTVTTPTFTSSVYVKYANRQFIQILFSGGVNDYANFDLINGTVTGGTYISASITNEGNGWFRISIAATATVSTFDAYLWAIDSSTATRVATSNGIGFYYIWGAQLSGGSSTLPYFPTTTRLNIPRIDYSTGTAALLMEPQRTNIVLRSEEFDNASWAKLGATVIANDTTAPNGLPVADRITQSGATVNFSQSISLPAGVVTFTTYVKKGNFDSASGFLFGFFSTITGDVGYINFNFATGTTSVYSGTFISHSATNVGNGWYRIHGTINVPSAGIGYFYNGAIGLSIAGVGSYYYSWGAQVEAGSFATSYIPTTSASVTRNADASTTSGMNTFIGQTEGTIILDINTIAENSDWVTIGPISGSAYINGIGLGYYSNSVRFTLSSPSGTLTSTTASITGRNKIAIAYKSGDSSIYINGVSIFSSAGAFSFGVLLDSITVASSSFQVGSIANNKLYSCTLYKTRLSNAELITLTK